MDYGMVKIPVKLLLQSEDEPLMAIDADYFPWRLKFMRAINHFASELHYSLVEAGWELWAMPTPKALQ